MMLTTITTVSDCTMIKTVITVLLRLLTAKCTWGMDGSLLQSMKFRVTMNVNVYLGIT